MKRGVAVLGSVILLGSLVKLQPQTGVARISSTPPLSASRVADLEARVRANPQDLASRLTLLRWYADSAPVSPNDDPVRRLARLDHILFLIEHRPELPILATPVAYVAQVRGAYANPSDHQIARTHWLAAIDSHPGNTIVIVNAVRFLAVEDKDAAEDVLQRALAVDPGNREIAANLGFLYAMEILGLDSLRIGAKPSGAAPDVAAHARAELDRSVNPFVLAGAGTAIPNLAMGASPGRGPDPKLFDLASTLLARARQRSPDDPDIQGPMPLIRYFADAHETPAGTVK